MSRDEALSVNLAAFASVVTREGSLERLLNQAWCNELQQKYCRMMHSGKPVARCADGRIGFMKIILTVRDVRLAVA